MIERRGTAAELVQKPAGPFGPAVFRCVPVQGALIMGSTQPVDVVDGAAATAAGLEVIRRPSGGGLVVIDPVESMWVEVTLPRTDPRWDDDVRRSFDWLGHRWAAAVAAVAGGAHRVEVHRGAPVATEAGRVVCFAGLGPGEVSVDGRKVVGLSQRRDRDGARFQCVLHRRFDVPAVMSLLGPAVDRRLASEVADRLERAAGGLSEAEAVVERLLADLSA